MCSYPQYSLVEIEETPAQEKTILVVEDDSLLLEFVHDFLKLYGFNILEASNTQEALKYLEDKVQLIDLIFSDIRIPGGMDGIELARKAKELRGDLKVLLTTGYSPEILKNSIQEEFEVLQKPYFPNILAQAIHTMLDTPFSGKPDGKKEAS